jgi:hypothetical protein
MIVFVDWLQNVKITPEFIASLPPFEALPQAPRVLVLQLEARPVQVRHMGVELIIPGISLHCTMEYIKHQFLKQAPNQDDAACILSSMFMFESLNRECFHDFCRSFLNR